MTYKIGSNEFQIARTTLGQYLSIVRLMESMQIKQPFEIKASGDALVYVGRFFDELVTKKALARFFSIILIPTEPMPLWILGGLIRPIRTRILLAIEDEVAIQILNDFFLAKKDLWDKLVSSLGALKSGKKP